MKLYSVIVLAVSALSITRPTVAQINRVDVGFDHRTSEGFVMGLVADAADTFTAYNYDWSSPSSPASLTASQTMTWGLNDGASYGSTGLANYDFTMYNCSGREVIRGKNNNGGTATDFWLECASSVAIDIDILGPTLNNYGITGATHFTWTATTALGYSNSGSGEASFTVPASDLFINYGGGRYVEDPVTVTIYPSNDNELGAVQVNCTLH